MAEKPRTIDEYLAGLDDAKRAALERVRKAIRAAVPDAEEGFSYGMPAFRLGDKAVAGFAAGSSHCAFYPMSGTIIGAHRADLAGYETSKGAVRFPAHRVLPGALVRKLVKARIAEIGGPAAERQVRRAGQVRGSGSVRRSTKR